MYDNHHQVARCGTVLAGGDGKRLKTFVQRWTDSDLPKQYVTFTGGHSTLEQTTAHGRSIKTRRDRALQLENQREVERAMG